ncbi:MAG: phosphopyruvate hydratase [Opitutales bacterium]|nr:phosphopyruvate hydratase [Opitutales bacterium]MCH8541075.1 phosphopyruvate hydratase [Opitutales bacterium]
MTKIQEITALEILDSRGNPTLSVTVRLDDGHTATAAVPSGASTGEREAAELRDGDPSRYGGKGVLKAAKNVETEIADALHGLNPIDQAGIDRCMIELDGTPNKARLGANAILGVSMAVARAGALVSALPLYRYLGGADACILPVPCLNVINGGGHASNNVDFQEFKIAPHSAPTFAEGLRMATETFHALKSILHAKGLSTGVGDEGGFAPDLVSNEQAVEVILEAIAKAGYEPGKEISLCLDPAVSELWQDGQYVFSKSGGPAKSSDEMIALWANWLDRYPIVLLEDPLAENDWPGWEKITAQLGARVEIVGDDLLCTNSEILQQAIDRKVANSILIKLNQIGTVTETLDCIALARRHGYAVYVSHRSGETEDTFIADLAVASGCAHLKTGSACRSERVAKFNRLLAIERELGASAIYGGKVWRK